MNRCRIALLPSILIVLALAAASASRAADPPKLWRDHRITPEQPFPARAIGIIPSWIGYAVLLEEITEEEPRLCIAYLWANKDLDYIIVSEKKAFRQVHDAHKATYLYPGVDIDNFSWSIGAYKIGRRFEEEDFVSQQYPRWIKRAQTSKNVQQDASPK